MIQHVLIPLTAETLSTLYIVRDTAKDAIDYPDIEQNWEVVYNLVLDMIEKIEGKNV